MIFFDIFAATCRFWDEHIGRGHHVHTRPLSVYSGATSVILFSVGCWFQSIKLSEFGWLLDDLCSLWDWSDLKELITLGALQETIKKQVASLYLWPRTLEIPILDASTWVITRWYTWNTYIFTYFGFHWGMNQSSWMRQRICHKNEWTKTHF